MTGQSRKSVSNNYKIFNCKIENLLATVFKNDLKINVFTKIVYLYKYRIMNDDLLQYYKKQHFELQGNRTFILIQ